MFHLPLFRFRNWVLVLGSLFVLGLLLFTDPDKGIGTSMLMLSLVACILAVACTHITRKALADYPEADMRCLYTKAGESPVGAGLALIAQAIIIASLLFLFGGRVHAQPAPAAPGVPAQALHYAPMLKAEQMQFWASHPAPELLAGLVEQESCPSLSHTMCWSPAAQLKTAREEGAGLGQITRAYSPNGTLRFDALAELRSRHPELQALSWANVYQRPDLQLRAMVLMSRGLYQSISQLVPNPQAALAFADAAYNGGLGGVQADRRACGLKQGCNPQQWFGHVEATCTKSQTAIYGQRSACSINREHVRQVMLVRSGKYRGLMGALA
jgi:hypothetical protein